MIDRCKDRYIYISIYLYLYREDKVVTVNRDLSLTENYIYLSSQLPRSAPHTLFISTTLPRTSPAQHCSVKLT